MILIRIFLYNIFSIHSTPPSLLPFFFFFFYSYSSVPPPLEEEEKADPSSSAALEESRNNYHLPGKKVKSRRGTNKSVRLAQEEEDKADRNSPSVGKDHQYAFPTHISKIE